jgi:hypothetical protein
MKAVHKFMVKKENRKQEKFDQCKVHEQLDGDVRRLKMALMDSNEGKL